MIFSRNSIVAIREAILSTTETGLKPQKYKEERPPEHFYEANFRVRFKKPSLIHEFARVISGILGFGFLGMRAIDSKYIRQPGAMIIAPNHNSNFDHFIVGWFTHRRVHFVAKSQLFWGWFFTWFFSSGGCIPIQRGREGGDQEGLTTARIVLERRRALIMYPGGGRSRTGKPPKKPKPGIGQLALETGAAVVPCAILDSELIRFWKKGVIPRVTVKYGPPIRFPKVENPSYEEQMAVATVIHARSLELLRELAENYARPARHLRLATPKRA